MSKVAWLAQRMVALPHAYKELLPCALIPAGGVVQERTHVQTELMSGSHQGFGWLGFGGKTVLLNP